MAESTSRSAANTEVAQRVHPDPIHPKARKTQVIDTDFHITPEFSSLHKYLQEPFRTKLQSYPISTVEYDARYAISMEDSGLTVHGVVRTGEQVVQALHRNGVDTVVVT